jgi:hemolysin activation/secretion protein
MPDTTPFVVRQLRIEGNTVVDTATLQALVASLEGQRLTLPQIAQGIQAITTYYRAAGYPLARTIIPAQTIENGVLRVQVIEANWGQVELHNNSAVKDTVLMRTLFNLEPGSVIRLDALERATLLLSDLPGVAPRALLRAGTADDSASTSAEREAAIRSRQQRIDELQNGALPRALQSPRAAGSVRVRLSQEQIRDIFDFYANFGRTQAQTFQDSLDSFMFMKMVKYYLH